MLAPLKGSCIYGAELKDYFVFSTATEPGKGRGNRLLDLLSRTRGPGILAPESDVVICAKEPPWQFEVLTTQRKDRLPYGLFQFGSVRFPAGASPTNRLYAYGVANVGHDLSMERWDLT